VGLNVKANQRLLEYIEPGGGELFVQPAASDAGTALGAATYAAHHLGDTIRPMENAYLGPDYTNDHIEAALKARGISYERCDSITDVASDLLARSEVVAWFQGRMEFGPRALGNRSILGIPSNKGISDPINAQIKYRERWRPFCPSILVRSAGLADKSSSPT
jgi:carbamoyltransferase